MRTPVNLYDNALASAMKVARARLRLQSSTEVLREIAMGVLPKRVSVGRAKAVADLVPGDHELHRAASLLQKS